MPRSSAWPPRCTTAGTSIASHPDIARESRHSRPCSGCLRPNMCTRGLEAPSTSRETGRAQAYNEERHVDPTASLVELVGLIVVMGTAAFTIIKVARLWTGRPQLPSADVAARLDALEQSVPQLQQEQAETPERLDF